MTIGICGRCNAKAIERLTDGLVVVEVSPYHYDVLIGNGWKREEEAQDA